MITILQKTRKYINSQTKRAYGDDGFTTTLTVVAQQR